MDDIDLNDLITNEDQDELNMYQNLFIDLENQYQNDIISNKQQTNVSGKISIDQPDGDAYPYKNVKEDDSKLTLRITNKEKTVSFGTIEKFGNEQQDVVYPMTPTVKMDYNQQKRRKISSPNPFNKSRSLIPKNLQSSLQEIKENRRKGQSKSPHLKKLKRMQTQNSIEIDTIEKAPKSRRQSSIIFTQIENPSDITLEKYLFDDKFIHQTKMKNMLKNRSKRQNNKQKNKQKQMDEDQVNLKRFQNWYFYYYELICILCDYQCEYIEEDHNDGLFKKHKNINSHKAPFWQDAKSFLMKVLTETSIQERTSNINILVFTYDSFISPVDIFIFMLSEYLKIHNVQFLSKHEKNSDD